MASGLSIHLNNWRVHAEPLERDFRLPHFWGGGKAMSTTRDDLVLEYYERQLIRRALVSMAYREGVKVDDAETLKRLEHQLADAATVLLRGVPRY